MEKGEVLYSGKAKTVYTTDDPNLLIIHFRDDISAYETKRATLAGKGEINNRFNTFIMEQLERNGVTTHFVKQLSATDALVKRLDMVAVECVIRNIAAGSFCKRLGIKEGVELSPPIFEFFLKDDSLHDPLLTEAHILYLQLANKQEMNFMRQMSEQVNRVLKPIFAKAGMLLVDFKLEFGRYQGNLILGDEFSPDSCRLWDKQTGKSYDKDRFRKDMGDVIEFYEEAARRVGIDA